MWRAFGTVKKHAWKEPAQHLQDLGFFDASRANPSFGIYVKVMNSFLFRSLQKGEAKSPRNTTLEALVLSSNTGTS